MVENLELSTTSTADMPFNSVRSSHLKICMVSLPEALVALSSGSDLLDPLTAQLVDERTIFLFNKTDMASLSDLDLHRLENQLKRQTGSGGATFAISVRQQEGLTAISDHIKERLDKT